MKILSQSALTITKKAQKQLPLPTTGTKGRRNGKSHFDCVERRSCLYSTVHFMRERNGTSV
jgi:hypothetical protein